MIWTMPELAEALGGQTITRDDARALRRHWRAAHMQTASRKIVSNFLDLDSESIGACLVCGQTFVAVGNPSTARCFRCSSVGRFAALVNSEQSLNSPAEKVGTSL